MLSQNELKAFYEAHCKSYGLGIDLKVYELVNIGTDEFSSDITCVLDAMILWNEAVGYTLSRLNTNNNEVSNK